VASELPISTIIKLEKICQFQLTTQIAQQKVFQGGVLNDNYVRLIYMYRKAVEFVNNAQPNTSTLRQTAEYLYALLQPFVAAAQQIIVPGTISISNPANVSILVGQNATFSVTVTVSTGAPFTIQWYRGGVAIPGATSTSYILTNAQLSDSGSTFYAIASTPGIGTATSGTATLTVTAAEVGFYYQGVTDYSTQLLANTDNVPYLGTFPITTGQPFTVTFPNLVSNEYIVVKYPNTEPTKTIYINPPPSGPDTGPIPNIALENNAFSTWKYIFSRTGNPFGVNGINGQVKFS
jgi:hypothetical protein